MTRRVVPECKALDILRHWERNEGAIATGYEERTQSFRFDYCPDKKRRISIDHLNLIPSYKVGEEIAVAQSYKFIHEEMMVGDYGDGIYDAFRWAVVDDKPGWNNKMFTLPMLMPHRIRITNLKVERLQDISKEDCLKEGIDEDFADGVMLYWFSVSYKGISWEEYKKRTYELSCHERNGEAGD